MIKSILAGIAIAIGAYINLKVGGVAGAVLFSVGLFLVCNFKLNLYTGKVGYTGIIKNLSILLGNLIGSLFLYFYPTEKAIEVINTKMNTPIHVTIINSIICGILIYAAVEAFKHKKDYMILICVPAFILFGAEHCVADMCYAASAHFISPGFVIYIITIVLGNSIGSLLFRYFTKGDIDSCAMRE